jgi:molybdopterin-guanine dinucleotide biosynthesis protein A
MAAVASGTAMASSAEHTDLAVTPVDMPLLVVAIASVAAALVADTVLAAADTVLAADTVAAVTGKLRKSTS